MSNELLRPLRKSRRQAFPTANTLQRRQKAEHARCMRPRSCSNTMKMKKRTREERDQHPQSSNETSATPSALTHDALLDAVPYSHFSPILDGEAKNIPRRREQTQAGQRVLYFGLRHGETLVFLELATSRYCRAVFS